MDSVTTISPRKEDLVTNCKSKTCDSCKVLPKNYTCERLALKSMGGLGTSNSQSLGQIPDILEGDLSK